MLGDKIASLARAVRDEVGKYKSENRVKLSKRTVIRRCDMELRYLDDVGLGRFPHQRIEKDVWDVADLKLFFSSVLIALDEYKSLAAALAEAKNDSPPSIDIFVGFMANESYKGLSDEKLTAYVNRYAGQLNGVVHLTVYIDGISIGESPLVISDGMVLRRPVAEDMAEYVAQDGVGGIYGPKGWAFFRVIGEFNFGPSFEMAQETLLRVLAALRLFRVGGVVSNRYMMKGSFLRPDAMIGGFGGRAPTSSPCRLRIQQQSTSSLKILCQLLHSRVRKRQRLKSPIHDTPPQSSKTTHPNRLLPRLLRLLKRFS
jgi:hypothetical protein